MHQNIFGWDALHEAAYSGRTSVVTLLLGSNADPNTKDNDARTPLMKASCMGRRECVGALLTAKADPLLEDIRDESALSLAHKKRFRPTAALLDRWIAGRVHTYYLSGEDDNPPGESRRGDQGLDMAARNGIWKAKASTIAHKGQAQAPKPPPIKTHQEMEVAVSGWSVQKEDANAIEERIATLEAALKASRLELSMQRTQEKARGSLPQRGSPNLSPGTPEL